MYPEKFTQDNVIALFLHLSAVTDTLPNGNATKTAILAFSATSVEFPDISKFQIFHKKWQPDKKIFVDRFVDHGSLV